VPPRAKSPARSGPAEGGAPLETDGGGPVLIVAAFAPELRALGRIFARDTASGAAPTRAAVGVGLIEAAAGAARVLEQQKPRALILVGTAGIYPGTKLSIGQAVVAGTVHLASASVAAEAAYYPGPLPAKAEATPLGAAIAQAARLSIADVACPLGITRDAAVARQLKRATGAALENLEAFAVARAAAHAGVPFAAVLGIANYVGPEAHAEWKQNGDKAAATACAAVRTWLMG
jgi:nucleoside phosphorylase